MTNGFSIAQIRDTGQGIKRSTYQNRLGRWTLGYGKWVPRLVSPYITWTLLRLFPAITPNMVSYLMIVACIGAHVLLFEGHLIWGGILLYLSIVLDKVDGEVARMRKIFTYRGIFLDYQYHYVYWLLFLSIGLGMYVRSGSLYPLLVGVSNSLLGIYIEFTQMSYHKVIWKKNDSETPSRAPDIQPYQNKSVRFFLILCNPETVSILLIICAFVNWRYLMATTFFLYFFLIFLAVNLVILFISGFRKM